MAKCWCVNFDAELVLRHGLANAMWLMQYQYAHGVYDYQGHKSQIAATSANLNILPGIEADDWFVAYLPKSTFYAIGQVIEPREHQRYGREARHTDTVERTVRQHSHRFLDGVVRYTDAAVLYEDFTDPWRRPAAQTSATQPSEWVYPQRIDVREWVSVVPSGVQVNGLADAVSFPTCRRAAFEIPREFFDVVAAALMSGGRVGMN